MNKFVRLPMKREHSPGGKETNNSNSVVEKAIAKKLTRVYGHVLKTNILLIKF